ncbi:MFS transporter [Thioclava sp. GXIMD4216]|uniref:MFS transporter n=1 Tax=Thioclava sp. GXIMD4216 TaxID=3131929 RepID=UPI0030D3ED45
MSDPVVLTRPQIWLLTTVAGVAIAGNFSLQPLLPAVCTSLGVPISAAGWIAAAPSLGYAAGLLIFVPMGDRYAANRLIAWQLAGLALCLGAVALAPNLGVLLLASALGGSLASAAAQCAAFGGRLAGMQRGRVVGTIAMGIALGILLGRVVGGALGEALGWRAMTALLGAVTLMMGSSVALWAPRVHESVGETRVFGLLRAVPLAFCDAPALRLLAVAGGAWFAMFSGTWAVLALYLATPAFGFGPIVAGSFGLIGVAGALSSQFAGRASDQFGPRVVMQLALGVAIIGVVSLVVFGHSLWGLALGIFLIDVGSFAAQATNQALILGLTPGRAGRDYSAYMVVYYGLGTLGAACGPVLFAHIGWRGLCLWSLALCFVALICANFGARRARADPQAMAPS